MAATKEEIKELAEHIYDLDAEVYVHLGSSLGRVFNRDRERCVNELTELLTTRPQGHLVRSELGLIANMARTIEDKEERAMCMTEYNRILNEVMSLPTSFASGDVIDPILAKLNSFNVANRFSNDDHLIICISWTYGSGGIDVGFKLADKLHINYYDADIFEAVLKRLDAEKDKTIRDAAGYAHVSEELQQSPASEFEAVTHMSLKDHIKYFSRYHGLSRQDAVFFNQSDLICDMAKKEDFIIMGRCADAILTNNGIPHISIYITAPFAIRVRRMMELKNLDLKQAINLVRKMDHKHQDYYHSFTGKRWGDAINYDLCINSACYGIDESVELIGRLINRQAKLVHRNKDTK